MPENKFQTKTNNIAQICYQDSNGDWIPITSGSPLPVGTAAGNPLSIRIIGDNGEAVDVVQTADGSYALKVDTELTVNVDNVSIGNVKVGSDGTNDTKLKTTSDGIVATQLTFRDSVTQQPIYISEDNPLPTGPLLTLGGTIVKNVVETSAHDLQATQYTASTSITTDYILDNIELKFSTNEIKTITISTTGGNILWGGTLNSSPSNAGYNTKGRHFNLSFGQAFNANENININVTQTTNACTLDCTVRIKTGVDSLMGNPSAAVYLIDPIGNPYGVAHVDNKIRTSSVDYTYDIAAGNIPNHSIFRSFGERQNTAVAVNGVDIWAGVTDSIPIPLSTGEQMSAVSTSTQDASAGTGVRKVVVHYLDENGDEGIEELTLNGTTPVNLTLSTVSFVNDFHASQVGANTVAVGDISIYKTSDVSRVYSRIAAGGNFALTCSKKVPNGKRFFLTAFNASITGNKPTAVRLRSTDHGLDMPYTDGFVFLFKDTMFLETGALTKTYTPPIAIPSKSIIKVTAWATQAGPNIGAGFSGWLE